MSNNTLSETVSTFINKNFRISAIKTYTVTLNCKLNLDDFLNIVSGVLPSEYWEDKMNYVARDEKVKQWFFSLDESKQLYLLERFTNQIEYLQEQGAFDEDDGETYDNLSSDEIAEEHHNIWVHMNEALDRRVESNDAIMASVEEYFDQQPDIKKSFEKKSSA